MPKKPSIMQQKCGKCKQIKPREEFGTRKGGALDTYCLKCRGIYAVKPKPHKPKQQAEYKTYGLSPYQLLAARIIEQALDDFKYLKKHDLEFTKMNGMIVSRAGLYRFFNEEYRYLTSVDAEYILRRAE